MNRVVCRSLVSVCVFLFAGSWAGVSAFEGKHSKDRSLFSPSEYREWVSHLASNELEGRGTGQEGIDKAADFIVSQFKRFGVKPAGEDGTYFQQFTLPLKQKIAAGTRLAIGTDGRRVRRPVRLNEKFRPFPFSASGSFKGDVVFAGYGIVNHGEDYDDYEGLDVTDKIVLILRRAPHFGDFSMRDKSFRMKAFRASEAGAAALLVVNPVGDEEGQRLYRFDQGDQGVFRMAPQSYGLPMLHLRKEVADQMLAAAGMSDLETLQERIEDSKQPVSGPLEGVTVRGSVNLEKVDSPVRNVVGMIPGTGPQSDEMIVLGAHYDHHGVRKKGRADFDPDEDIYNGADDNASGTAMLFALARAYTEGAKPNRSILLIAFTAEELGLHGSRHFTKNPTVDLEKCIAMLNFDMVGRLQKNRLLVGGMRTGGFEDMVHEFAETYDIVIKDGGGGRGPSDHTWFYNSDIPVMFFHTGLHAQYSQPGDDTRLVNVEGAIRIAKLVADCVDEIDRMDEAPEFAEDTGRLVLMRNDRDNDDDEDEDEARPLGGPERPVRLGVMPDMDDDGAGILISRVMDGSAADRAGMEDRDRILKIGKTEIVTLEDVRDALGRFKTGDKTTVLVARGSEKIKLDVNFGEPRSPATEEEPPGERVRLGIMPDADDAGRGVLVAEVTEGSPASRAGMEEGDRIVRIGRWKVTSVDDAIEALSRFKKGDETTIRVKRDDRTVKLKVRFGLASGPTARASQDMDDDVIERPSPPVTLRIMPTYGESDGEGFEIAGVIKGGAADKAGMKDTDRIYKIGDQIVTNIEDYMRALRPYKPGDVVTVTVLRGGKKVKLKVKAEGPRSKEAD
ncbi:MAG: M28 family peptidase [Phycisphaerales bacterium]|nr:M28 family peptidase [Phycisphaerales bacterium]